MIGNKNLRIYNWLYTTSINVNGGELQLLTEK